VDNEASVINMSVGGNGSSTLLKEAIKLVKVNYFSARVIKQSNLLYIVRVYIIA